MKKRLVSLFLVLCTLCYALPAQSVVAQTQTQKIVAAYTAYWAKLTDILSPSGALDYINSSVFSPGDIVFAKLMDFSGDGINDLFLLRHTNTSDVLPDFKCEIYAYKNGELDYNSVYLPWLDSGETYPRDSDRFGFCTDKNGRNYLFVECSKIEDDGGSAFFSFTDGNRVEYRTDIKQNNNRVKDYQAGKIERPKDWNDYYINGKLCTKEEMLAYSDSFKTNGYTYFDKQNPPLRSSVKATYNFLIKNISPDFVRSYITPSPWAADAVAQAEKEGLLPSNLDRSFTKPITRLEFCTLALNLYEKRTGATLVKVQNFSDTTDSAVRRMAGLGIVGGVGDGKFNPDGLLTREMAAIILVRLAEAMGATIPANAPTFSDNSSISSWAKDFVGRAQAAGIMSGTGGGRFSPQDNYTREQSVVTLLALDKCTTTATDIKVAENSSYIPSAPEGRNLVGSNRNLATNTTGYIRAFPTNPGNMIPPDVMVKSSNPDVVFFAKDTSTEKSNTFRYITGGPGTSTVTVYLPNGPSYTFTVTVKASAKRPYVTVPQELSFYDTRGFWLSSDDLFCAPETPVYAGKIRIESCKVTSFDIVLNYKLIDKNPDVCNSAGRVSPYIRWYVEDSKGVAVASGVSQLSGAHDFHSQSDELISLSKLNLKDGETYRVCFIDEGC